MKEIKSKYIISYIFSYISDSTKLKFALYNKQLQNAIGINIINYSIFSGRYRIINEKGDGDEYDIFNDEIIFQGKYLNGKRNGKGKEYKVSGELVFEGEYLNGKRNGLGIEYHKNGKMKFNGEYKDGKKWNGKVYNYSEDLICEFKEGKGMIDEYNDRGSLKSRCSYVNGEKNGIGTEYYYDNGFSYEISIEYLNGKKWNGKRELDIAETKRIRYNNYCGQFVYELKEGKGYISKYDYKGKLIYIENYLNGERNGKKINMLEFSFGMESEKEYLNNKLNGFVKEYFRNGKLQFEGEYLYDHKRKGKEYFDNGRIKFEGEYLYDKYWDGIGYDYEGKEIFRLIQGKGKIVEYSKLFGSENSVCFIGEYLYGKRNGKGKEYNGKNNLLFEGEYINGKRNGKGKEYNSNFNYSTNKNEITFFEGNYLNGVRYGKGKEYDNEGNILFEGEYCYGKRWNGVGIEKYVKTLIFQGEYKNGKYWNGKGIDYEIKNGKGFIKERNIYGQVVYEGEYLNGLRNGKGKEINFKGNILFEGEYYNGQRWNGKLKEYESIGWEERLLFEGEVKNGKLNGKCKEYNFKKLKFEGEYLNGKRNGKGKEYDYDEKLKFEGEYLEGKRNGKGKEYYNNGTLEYEGQYLYGERIGFGKEYFINGNLLFEGEFKGRQKWTGKGYDSQQNVAFEIKDGNGYMKYYEPYCGKLSCEGNYKNGELIEPIKRYNIY